MSATILWGGTGHARVLREALRGKAEVIAVFDNRDIPSPFDDIVLRVGEAGFLDWERSRGDVEPPFACVAIGGGKGDERLQRMDWLLARGYSPLTVIHPRAFVALDATLGAGCQVLAQGAVCSSARLGRGVIVNTGASVDHDCVVGDGVHLAPGARAAGEVRIGDHAFIGCGAIILPRIKIGTGATVGAGAVVTRDVADGDTVVGNPARTHKQE